MAKKYNVWNITLYRFIPKLEEDTNAKVSYPCVKRVLTSEEETTFQDYTFQCYKVYFGTVMTEVRKIGFELVVIYKKKFRRSGMRITYPVRTG